MPQSATQDLKPDKLYVVGDSFYTFCQEPDLITYSELMSCLRQGSRSASKYVIGQGINLEQLTPLRRLLMQQDSDYELEEVVSLKIKPAYVHKQHAENVLITIPDQVGENEFAVELVLDGRSAALQEQAPWTQIPESLLIEAARQFYMAAFQMLYLGRFGNCNGQTSHVFTTKNFQIDYSHGLSPLRVEGRLRFDSLAWDNEEQSAAGLVRITFSQNGKVACEVRCSVSFLAAAPGDVEPQSAEGHDSKRGGNAAAIMDPASELRSWVENETSESYPHLGQFSFHPSQVRKNIENLIGAGQVPVGLGGPIRVNGEHAQGDFYVPFATTEGTLVATYEYGMRAITRAGGANVRVMADQLDISPAFIVDSLKDAIAFVLWVKNHFAEIKAEAEKTTRHGRLLQIHPYILGRHVYLQFCYHTGDAMGLNMVNIATEAACRFIITQRPVTRYYLRANLSTDKKASFVNLMKPYGKEVLAEVAIPRKVLSKFFAITAQELQEFFVTGVIGSQQAGMIGINAHFANALAAIYIACGQDVAQIVNASIGIVTLSAVNDGDLYMSAKLPNLVVATVGGGTNLPTQSECLKIMGCHGDGCAKKFAEIIAATLLAGELSIYAALARGRFIQAHMQKRML